MPEASASRTQRMSISKDKVSCPNPLANKKRNGRYNPLMGSERASSVRQRYAGKICCECSSPLPPPHRRGERLCDRCGGASRKRVYMHFVFRKGWHCQFLRRGHENAAATTDES